MVTPLNADVVSVGNFPHAFLHLALVEAAARIVLAEGLITQNM